MQARGREDDEVAICQVYHDWLGPLQKRILQAITEVYHQEAGRVRPPRDP